MKKMKTLIFIFLAIFLQANTYAATDSKIDMMAHDFMKKNKIDGMSIAVLENNKSGIFNYGYADPAKKTPTTSDTIYTIASFTKTFTATVAAIAAVEKKLNLDASFIHYLPELKNNHALEKITITQLLAHVSSLPFDFDPRPTTYTSAIDELNQFKPEHPPGSVYAYSNAGIGIVGYILQNVYAEDYQTILSDEVLKPLHLTSTFLVVPFAEEKNMAVGHDKDGKALPFTKDIEIWFAAASLKSTISDMAKYLQAQLYPASIGNNNLAKAISLVHKNKYCLEDKVSCEQLAWEAHDISLLNKATDDTYFIRYDKKNNNPVLAAKKVIENKEFANNKIFIDKTGSGYGMSSYMAYIPAERKGIVILINKSVGEERIELGRDVLLLIG
jgi:beta-lactamase class C